MIEFNSPYNTKLEIKFLNEVTTGNYNDNHFRNLSTELLKEKFKFDNILLTNSATSALEMAALIYSFDKKKSKNLVKLPSYTFSSTANAFLRAGYELKFEDIDKDNLMLDINNLKLLKNELLCIVHYAGSSIDFNKLKKINGYRDSFLIEDAAQGLGVQYNNKQVGTFGRFGCISFHPTKNLHSGFGGLLNTKTDEDYEKATFILERGTDRSKVIAGNKNKYEWVEVGSSFEITELSSAVLYAQLLNYDKIQDIRKEIYYHYKICFEELVNLNKFKTQIISKLIKPNFHSYYLVLEEDSTSFIEYMYQNGVKCYIGYVPLHNSLYGIKNNLNHSLPNTQYISNKVVRLPLHPNLDSKSINKIVNLVKKYFLN